CPACGEAWPGLRGVSAETYARPGQERTRLETFVPLPVPAFPHRRARIDTSAAPTPSSAAARQAHAALHRDRPVQLRPSAGDRPAREARGLVTSALAAPGRRTGRAARPTSPTRATLPSPP